MTPQPAAQTFETRYLLGADEFVVVELAEGMSLQVNMRSVAITKRVHELELPGVVDICPANASYMLRFDPDRLDPRDLVAELRKVEEEVGDARDFHLRTRILDVPVMYDDPWTHETLMRFRDRHQTPDGTDIQYAAKVNGFESEEAFKAAHSGAPYIVSMRGFVPTTPWCYQLVGADQQIDVPKYVRPRTDTPERAFGHGGCFAVIYPVRGAGGYQIFGRAPAPIFNREQRLPDFEEDVALFRSGDIVKYRRVEQGEYDEVREQVKTGVFEYRKAEVEFVPARFDEDPQGTRDDLMSRLYGDSGP